MDDLYISPDSPLSTIGFLALLACMIFVFVSFSALCARRRTYAKVYALLGVASFALLVIAWFLLMGPGAVRDSEALWSCPTALQGIQLRENPGGTLPQGVVDCRDISRRNLVIASVLTTSALAVTFWSLLSRRMRSPLNAV
ncbi:hypothetical protein CIK61_15325 [Brevibacterium aurantiacum]|nr:hypothetical protein CIK63_12025 [Brevibacterium aurantiacum]RCS93465.1 hypothetical protein CIK61_15325 [Brevibacterium aurantiacum]